MMERKVWDSVAIGEAVGFITGPGQSVSERKGLVVSKIENRWGLFVMVEIDGSSCREIESVHGFVKVGIGAYRMKEWE